MTQKRYAMQTGKEGSRVTLFDTNERGAAVARAYMAIDNGTRNVRVLDRHTKDEVPL